MDATIRKMDSIFMTLLRSAMDHAYENIHSRSSPIECLNETSKFYELAFILISGSLSLIKQEPNDQIHELSRQNTLTDLIQLQDLLRGRLNNTKLLIFVKDKELIDHRLKFYQITPNNELQNIMIKQTTSDIELLKRRLDLVFGQKKQSSLGNRNTVSVVENKDAIITNLMEERHESSLQTMAMEEHYILLVNNCYKEFSVNEIETNLREDVFSYVLREVTKDWIAYDETESMKTQLTDEIYKSVFVETINDIQNEKFTSENEGFATLLTEDIYIVFLREVVEALNIERYLQELEISFVHDVYRFVIDGLKENKCLNTKNTDFSDQTLIMKTDFLSELSEQIKTELLNLRSSIEDQTTLRLVNEKLERVTKMLSSSQESLGEFNYGLVTEPNDAICIFLTGFQENICEKLHRNFARLERVNQQVDSLLGLAASIRNDELVYKKGFARRCENLVLAETEVDLLGDQVERLQGLLGKIYIVFMQNAYVLSTHDFEVMDILKSIKKELNS